MLERLFLLESLLFLVLEILLSSGDSDLDFVELRDSLLLLLLSGDFDCWERDRRRTGDSERRCFVSDPSESERRRRRWLLLLN